MNQKLNIFSDGGARGNPGPAAIAFVALDEKSQRVKEQSRFIGEHTNNQAEYEALIMALTFAASQKASEVTCYLDSELVGKQVNGEYAVKNAQLRPLWERVQALKAQFAKTCFFNVRRSNPNIARADELVNRVLDEEASKYKNSQTNLKVGEGMFVHASIRTSNMERSIDFYARFLGLKLLSRSEIKRNNAEIAFMQAAEGKGCKLELTFYRSQRKFIQAEYEDRVFDHLGFEVKDMDRLLKDMRREGVVVTDEPFQLNAGTTIAFIEDPDGTLIELIEHK
jgi:lactoylglutathione lyase